MCNILKTLDAYDDWALDNPSKCSPRLSAFYTQLAKKAYRLQRATLSIDPADFKEVLGIKETRLIIASLDELSDANLILWVYRSKNGKKNHEICLLTFKHEEILEVTKTHPDIHPEVQPSDIQTPIQDASKSSLASAPAQVSNNIKILNNKPSEALREANDGQRLGVKVIKIPTLKQRIADFVSQHLTPQYPEAFYESFIKWYSKPSKGSPDFMRWEVLIADDGSLNLKAMLEKSWGKFWREYPDWTIGRGYPTAYSEATGTSGPAYGQLSATSSSQIDMGGYELETPY